MEYETQKLNQAPTLGRWTLLKELGAGATSKVFLALDRSKNQTAAIKVFMFDAANLIKLTKIMNNEATILQYLKHQNVLELKEFHPSIKCEQANGDSVNVGALVIEFAKGGEFFDLIQSKGCLSYDVARTFFKQIISALDYMHSKELVHRDIKPENILVDEHYNIKLADFGYSTKEKKSKFKHPTGTSIYFAPEIHEGKLFSGKQADLFAAGMILFVMISGHMPFMKATKDDKIFKMIRDNDSEKFWNFHRDLSHKYYGSIEFEDNFKDLIWKMFSPNPDHRLTLEGIKSHPFMKEKTLQASELAKTLGPLKSHSTTAATA